MEKLEYIKGRGRLWYRLQVKEGEGYGKTGVKKDRVVCHNFGHPAQTWYKIYYLQAKYSFATIVNRPSVLKLFQLSNGDLLISYRDFAAFKK